MKKVQVNDHVRLLDYPEDDINAYARVAAIYENGHVWIVNVNMPYLGTINKVVSKVEFIRMTGKTI